MHDKHHTCVHDKCHEHELCVHDKHPMYLINIINYLSHLVGKWKLELYEPSGGKN